MDDLERKAACAGVSARNFGDGSDGDALAALFENQWWAVVEDGAGGATEYGPYDTRNGPPAKAGGFASAE